MTNPADVVHFLIPQGGWIMNGFEYEGIQFIECEPITKKEFEDGFKKYESWLIEQAEAKAAKKAAAEAKLAALGLDADDLKALGLA